ACAATWSFNGNIPQRWASMVAVSTDSNNLQRVVVCGGIGTGNVYLNDVWSSADARVWERASANAPWGMRGGGGAIAINGGPCVMGGVTSIGVMLNDVWCGSVTGQTWTRVAVQPTAFSGRMYHSATAYGPLAFTNHTAYVTGGVSSSSVLTDSWETITAGGAD